MDLTRTKKELARAYKKSQARAQVWPVSMWRTNVTFDSRKQTAIIIIIVVVVVVVAVVVVFAVVVHVVFIAPDICVHVA